MKHIICTIIILMLQAPTNIGAKNSVNGLCEQSSKISKDVFDRSIIALMYNDDIQRLVSYNAGIITWGSQVEYFSSSIKKQKKLFDKYEKYGMQIYASNIALIQEGGKYVVCGGMWDPECNKKFWQLREKTASRKKNLQDMQDIKNRAVLGYNGEIVGVPWLKKKGLTIPMACVNDPGYKDWLHKKIDAVLKLRPKALHFDEPWMDFVALKSESRGCFTQHSLSGFDQFLKSKPEFNLQPYISDDSNTVDYKPHINRVLSSKNNMSLASEFSEFKLLSTLKLFGDLVEYVKQRSVSPVLITANASPSDWIKIHLIEYLDFLSPEISHSAAELIVPDAPISAYLIANAMDIPVFSTARGDDWGVIKSGEHEILASAWIAQAYATGQYMNFPSKTWVPGSTYKPETSIYPKLSSWIKDKSVLFDSYEMISTHALLISTDILRSPNDNKLLQGFIAKLIEKGILFRIVLDQGNNKTKIPAICLKNDESLILVLRDTYSKNTNGRLLTRHDKSKLWEPSKTEILSGYVKPGLAEVEVLDENGIFILPRKKYGSTKDSVVLHLLNRDYLPIQKMMKPKGPFHIRVSRGIFDKSKITVATLHQPILDNNTQSTDVNLSSSLSIREDGESLIITVPFLDLWGIVEFTTS